MEWLIPKLREKFAKNARKIDACISQTLLSWRNRMKSDKIKWSGSEKLDLWKKKDFFKNIKLKTLNLHPPKKNQADIDSTIWVSWVVKETKNIWLEEAKA